MINVIPSEQRYHADHGWLDTRWHFAFGDYYDPANTNWSSLRVFNDDVVHAGGGFDFHPHRDMEIVSYVVNGRLEHRDRLGNRHVNREGEVQVMSAGKGIVHAEFNPSATESMRLLPVVSDNDAPQPDTLTIDQDATIYVSSLEAGQTVEHRAAAGRKAYLFVIDGAVTLDGDTELSAGDQARVTLEGDARLVLKADRDAELILLDLPGE